MIFEKKYIQYLIFILLYGCSFYSFKGSLPPGVNSVYFSQVSNLTSEFELTNILNKKIIDRLITENVLEVVNFSSADSQLDLIITSVKNQPNVSRYSSQDNYELVEQWELKVFFKIIWYDINNNSIIFEIEAEEWAMYNNSGIDISKDGIDNDGDTYIDSQDSDEFGSPREASIKIIGNKIAERVLHELISIW